jgi:hypothetical protein
VTVEIYDAVGRRVMDIAAGTLSAGRNAVTFNAAGLPSGTYLYRVNARYGTDVTMRTGKMLLAK